MGGEIITKIEEKIDKVLDKRTIGNRPQKPRTRRRILRYLSVPATIKAILIASVLVGAVLLGVFQVYYLDMSGDVDLTGNEPDLYFDDIGLITQNTEIPMDITSMSYGESQAVTHTLSNNLEEQGILTTFDTSNMNDIFTNPENEWYGFYFHIEDMLDNTITEQFVNPSDSVDVEFNYAVDELFLNPNNPMPFDLDISYEVKDMYRCGFYVENPDTTSADVWLEDLTFITMPSDASEWEIIYSDATTVTYDTTEIDIYLDPSEIHSALVDKTVSYGNYDDYTITGVTRHNTRDTISGIIFEAQDTNNYYKVIIDKTTLTASTIQVIDGVPTTLDTDSYDPGVDESSTFTIIKDADTGTIDVDVSRSGFNYQYQIVL